jgi:hypothetical protein
MRRGAIVGFSFGAWTAGSPEEGRSDCRCISVFSSSDPTFRIEVHLG